MIPIKRFTPPDPVLPAVFNLNTGYEQQIKIIYSDFYKTTHYVIDSINEINHTIENMDDQIKQSVQDGLTEIRLEFEQLQKDVEGLDEYVTNAVERWENEIVALKDFVGEEVDDIKRFVENRVEDFKELLELTEDKLITLIGYRSRLDKEYTDNLISLEKTEREKADKRLEELINKISFEMVMVYNPTRGIKTDIQTATSDLWNLLRDGCLTADQWETLGMTADKWDALGWTTREYDLFSKKLLDHDKRDYMISPFNGKKQTVGEVLLELYATLNINGKTVDEYDDIGFTADEFDESDYDAYQQNTHKWYKTTNPDTYNNIVDVKKLLYFSNDVPSVGQELCKINGYDQLEIVCKLTASSDERDVYTVAVTSGSFSKRLPTNGYYTREYTVTNGLYINSTGRYGNDENNNVLVIEKIYGIKFVK